MTTAAPHQRIVIFGGSFDPIHCGHVAIIKTMNSLLNPTQLRIIPTGWSWQKNAYHANSTHRLAMLTLALKELIKNAPLLIDEQEIKRADLGIPSYSVDTLTNLRTEFGATASLLFVMGADQLQQLHQWKNWAQLFNLAHIVVVKRPGFDLNSLDNSVAKEITQRSGGWDQLQTPPFGSTLICTDLDIDISSTQIRNGNNLSLVPPDVLDYIQQHHLY